MAYNYEYPYTDPTRGNADWLLDEVKKLRLDFDNFASINVIKFHDPIGWDISSQYEKLEIVTNAGFAYLSKKEVPKGVSITNENYWQNIGSFGIDGDIIRKNIASENQGENLTADKNINKDTLIWWRGDLYNTLSDINTGEFLAIGVNIESVTIEKILNDMLDRIVALEAVTKEWIFIHGDGTAESIEKLRTALDNADTYPNNIIIDGVFTINTPFEIKRGVTIISHNAQIHQTVWGYPAVIVLADNVAIYGEIDLYADITSRIAITQDMSYHHLVDAKADSAGIELGFEDVRHTFYAESIRAYNFICGIVNLSNNFDNIFINNLYVENVDFGIIGAHYENMTINTIEFKDIASYIGSADPSHVVYFTGGLTSELSHNIKIGMITGSGCVAKSEDSVFQAKSTRNVTIENVNVSNVSAVFSIINSTGAIKGGYASGIKNYSDLAQGSNVDFIIENMRYYFDSTGTSQVVGITADNTGKVCFKNCRYFLESLTPARIIYCSGGNALDLIDCEYYCNSDAVVLVACASTNKISIINPYFKGILAKQTSSLAAWHIEVKPDRINNAIAETYPTSDIVFLPSSVVYHDTVSPTTPNFISCDKVSVDSGNVQALQHNGVGNGQLLTLINNGNAVIQNTNYLKTKTGQSITSWKVVQFVMVNNVAYEV